MAIAPSSQSAIQAENQQIVAPPAPTPAGATIPKGTNYVAPGSLGNVASPTYGTPAASSNSQTDTTPNQYSVVTSQPATDNYNAIQSTYQTQMQPNINAAAQATKAAQVQANSLPVIPGYTTSATPTGAQGETKATVPGTGQEYYISPQTNTPTANDIIGAISGQNTPTPSPTPQGGTQPQTPAQIGDQTVQNQYGVSTGQENQNYQQQYGQTQTQLDQAYSTFQSTITQIQSGSFPLSGAQQALVDATNQAFQQMTTQAQLKAAALSSETGGVSNMVNATAGELLNITSQQASTVAKLELGFQQQDYQEVTDSYDEFQKYETQKMTSIQNLHDAVMTTYNNAVDAAQKQQSQDLANAQFEETQFKDAATIAQGQYDFEPIENAFGQRIGTQAYSKTTGQPVGSAMMNGGQTDPTTGTTSPAVTTDPNTGAVDKDSQAAYLATLPTNMQALVQGIASGKIEPPSARTATGAEILSMVAQYDPTLSDGQGGFDATKYQARLAMQKSLANYTPGSYGSAIASANKLISHLSSYLNAATSIPKSQLLGMNLSGVVNAVGGGLGSQLRVGNTQSTESEANTISAGLTDEMAKFFKGTGSTDVNSLETWENTLNPNATNATVQGSVQGALTLFSGQLNTFTQQYTTVMGKSPDLGTILQPQTMQTLSAFKNAGYQVDIPGVPYTTQAAWDKYGGGTQEAWNNSVQALTAAGLPLTTENILQYAQQ